MEAGQREDRLMPKLVGPPVSSNLSFAWRMGGSFPAPSPWGASCGCEACGVWPCEARTLRICCYSSQTGSCFFWGRGSLGCLGLTLNFDRILVCDFMHANVGDMRGRKHMLGVAVLNIKCQNCNRMHDLLTAFSLATAEVF